MASDACQSYFNEACQERVGFFMASIQDILNQRLQTLQNPSKDHHLKHEWQAFAYKIWMDYSGEKRELPNVIRLVKRHHETDRPMLDRAYNFCKDYTGNVPKLKLFYWKFWQLKKQKQVGS